MNVRILSATAFANAVLTNMKDLCFRLKISEATARRYAKTEPGFPPALRLGPRRVAFRIEDIDRYLTERYSQALAGQKGH